MTPSETAEAATRLVAYFGATPIAFDAKASDIGAYRDVVRSIDALIPDASGDGDGAAAAANRIVQLAASLPATRTWMQHYVAHGEAPATLRIYDEPVGPPIETSLGARFVCPNGDFTFYRPSVGTPVPPCPHDGTALVRA